MATSPVANDIASFYTHQASHLQVNLGILGSWEKFRARPQIIDWNAAQVALAPSAIQ